MTSCDFGARALPNSNAPGPTQKQGRISAPWLSISRRNSNAKSSEKTAEQSIAIGLSPRWYYIDPNWKKNIQSCVLFSPKPKQNWKFIVSKSESGIFASQSPKLNSMSHNFSIHLNNCRSAIWDHWMRMELLEKLMAQQAAGKRTSYRPSTCQCEMHVPWKVQFWGL